GNGNATLTIIAGPDTRPQDYNVLISTTSKGVTTLDNIRVSLLCDPPIILGVDQPKSVTISRGASATLEARPTGSGPLSYQWYAGQAGVTSSPISGAAGRTFSTGPAGGSCARATNPSGTADRHPAAVQVR